MTSPTVPTKLSCGTEACTAPSAGGGSYPLLGSLVGRDSSPNPLVRAKRWTNEAIYMSVGMQMLFRVRGRCDGSEEPRAYSSVY